MEQLPIDLGRHAPSPALVTAVQKAIQRYGLTGLVTRVTRSCGLTWSPVAAVGFGLPVKVEHINLLEKFLCEAGLLPPSHEDTSEASFPEPSLRSES